jgi:hypothetical protein
VSCFCLSAAQEKQAAEGGTVFGETLLAFSRGELAENKNGARAEHSPDMRL